MTVVNPPPEAHRYGRSQTPESPRPLHIPEPSNIPVLQNQMDPVFNDTTTYDIRSGSQPVSSEAGDFRSPEIVVPSLSLHGSYENAMKRQNVESGGDDNTGTNDSNSQRFTLSKASTDNKAISHTMLDSSPSNANTSAPHSDPLVMQPSALLSQFQQNDRLYLQRADVPTSFQGYNGLHIQGPPNPSPSYLNENGSPPSRPPEGNTRPGQANVTNSTEDASAQEGINFQTLLDNISQSTATAPAADSVSATTTASPNDGLNLPQIGSEKPLPVGAGLPPRPPPQEKPAMHPNYSASESIRSFHQMPTPNSTATSYPNQQPPFRANAGNPPVNNAPLPTANARAPSGLLPPPPLASFQQPPPNNLPQQSPTVQNLRGGESLNSPGARGSSLGAEDDDRPWGPDVQEKYDQFLHDERIYVTEGVWDRFPAGSRLFVGNLPTEKVTKRDLFHIFHRHGKLAQISIKQAYGFVQFLEAASCYDALSIEQGVAIRGRKIHLEISKPQKNTRNAGPNEGKGASRRRSRSPDRRGGARAAPERFERGSSSNRLPFSDFRDEPARRLDGYRPTRSPSPRGYRARNDYRVRDRTPPAHNRWDGVTGSPTYSRNGGNVRSPSPRIFDDDAALPLPRRDPRDVPDVQILILEDVGQDFLGYIEQGFRAKGLRAQTIWLNPRITLAAVIKRQIIEGVQAVVKLTRNSQYSNKIPLQVFDRSAGASNVNFNEYVELDVYIAADIVIQARQKERMSAVPAPAYPPASSYGVPNAQYPYPPSQPQVQGRSYAQSSPQPYTQPSPQSTQPPPQYAGYSEPAYRGPVGVNPNPTPAAPNLQELLANLRQPPISQATSANAAPMASNGAPTDLAGLLSNVARQQSQAQGYGQAPTQPSAVDHHANRAPVHNYANHAGMPVYGAEATQAPQQNVQDIMEQLARWNK